jgi:amino acid transporter
VTQTELERTGASRQTSDADGDQLLALGYVKKFDRSMTVWQNFALGFTYLSPVCSVYSLFAFGLATGGPPMVWAYAIVGVGQMLVALIFGEVVSQFPITGGLYPWARRLVGPRWAWMAGWIYAWALFTTLAAIAFGAGPFLSVLLGHQPTPALTTITALALVLSATAVNLAGTRVLARVAMFGFVCEILGALAVGIYLLLFHRHHPIGIVVDRLGIGDGGHYLPAFLAASLIGTYTCYGFEACGDVAEETTNPGTSIPKAMRMTIYVGAAASAFIAVALILAVPDIQAVIAGKETNPIIAIMQTAFGPVGTPIVTAVVLVSFLSNLLSIQAAVSRLVYAYARDNMIVGSALLSRLSDETHVPAPALILSGVISGAIICLGYFMEGALATIASYCTAGIYISFQMIVGAALFSRQRGWKPHGQFALGRWGYATNLAALLYGIATIINILWPRGAVEHWYTHFDVLTTVVVVVGSGALYMALGRPYDKGISPAGDAWMLLNPSLVSVPKNANQI